MPTAPEFYSSPVQRALFERWYDCAVAQAPVKTKTTTGDTANRLGICRQTVRNWVRAGRLDGEKIGDRVLVSEASVAALERRP